MPEKIAFYFDPLCPWCYLTSKWVHRLVELAVVDVDWKVFSLEVHNTGKTSLDESKEFRAATALRTAIALRDSGGSDAVGRFYAALDAANLGRHARHTRHRCDPFLGNRGRR